MSDLRTELDDEALTPIDRLLVHLTASLARPDWVRFDAATALARQLEHDRQLLVECLLQATLFFGFPRAVSAFERLLSGWPASQTEDRARVPEAERPARGRQLFHSIYGSNANAVHDMLASFHPEFHDFVLESAYGRILSRSPLDPRQRELCAVSALAALDQTPQLIAHARGAMKFGATTEAVEAAMRVTLAPEAVDELMARVARRS